MEVTVEVAGSRGAAEEELSAEVLQGAAATFGILAATVRLHIVWLLAQGERDVSSLGNSG